MIIQHLNLYIKQPSLLFLNILNRFGTWLPDKLFLKVKFYLSMGYNLNLKNPKTFQEKIQWLKLYYRRPEFTQMVDKLAVKDYVSKLIGEQYIIPILGIWEKPEDIDYNSLPEKFVLKTTHGGGGSGVIVCRDKSKLDIYTTKEKLQKSLHSDIYKKYREWPYKNVQRRIIAEHFLENSGKADLIDYKIFCFHGEPRYIQVIQDRKSEETIDFFDMEWNHMEFIGLNPIGPNPKAQNATIRPEKPVNLEEMIDIARKLSEGIVFVRVDLYNINSKIYFGELTFYPASGIGKITPKEWSLKLGDLIHLNPDINN